MKCKQYFFWIFFFSPLVCLSAQKYTLLDTKVDHPSAVESIELAPDGTTMLTGHHDGYVVAWDLNTMQVVKKVQGHTDQVNTVLFDKSGTRFVTAGEDSKVVLWEWPSMKILQSYTVPPTTNSFAVLTPDGSAIYLGGANSNRRYDSNSGRYSEPYGALYKIQVKGNGRPEVAFDSDGSSYGRKITDGNLDFEGNNIVICKSYYFYFFNYTTRRLESKVTCPYELNNFTFTKDALYAWGNKMLMKLVKQDGQYVVEKTVKGGTRDVSSGYSKMVLSSDGKLLATGDDGYVVNIWDANTLEKKQTLIGHTDLVRNFLFWNKDSILITGGYDGDIKIWGLKPKEKDSTDTEDKTTNKEVLFTDNNIPLSLRGRDVELQSTVKVSEPTFDIEIWDKSVVDGDSISLSLNGEWILKDYAVVRTKHVIKVKLNPKQTNNYLVMYAHNLGEISPNTAAVSIKVNGKEYKLSLTSDMEKSGAINFEYIPD